MSDVLHGNISDSLPISTEKTSPNLSSHGFTVIPKKLIHTIEQTYSLNYILMFHYVILTASVV
jgi:hypothetical protein